MARSKSSNRWLEEHVNDPYVKLAQKDGYRSRASYKLLELLDKDRLLRPGMSVVDVGSAPGGWSQVLARRLKGQGRVLATDILPMDAVEGVHFIQGDFTEEAVFQSLLDALGGQEADLVVSDIAPNISGVDAADQAGAMYLVELALDLACQVLKPGGSFIAKLFQGEGSDAWLKQVRGHFDKVVVRKPAASRPRSREVYVVATGYRGNP